MDNRDVLSCKHVEKKGKENSRISAFSCSSAYLLSGFTAESPKNSPRLSKTSTYMKHFALTVHDWKWSRGWDMRLSRMSTLPLTIINVIIVCFLAFVHIHFYYGSCTLFYNWGPSSLHTCSVKSISFALVLLLDRKSVFPGHFFHAGRIYAISLAFWHQQQ